MTIMLFLLAILFLLMLLLAYYIHTLHLYKQQSKLRYLVAWSVTTHYSSTPSIRPGLDLIDYIYRAQRNLNIPTDYCFTKQSELEIVDILLKEYQRSLAQKYFNYNLLPAKFNKPVSGEQYFMYMLCNMLEQHQCDSYYLEHGMHAERLSYKEYGSWGATHYDATYLLSDFALTYHKLYYVAYLYCQHDSILNQNKDFSAPDSIKEIINTQKINVCCY